jgi:hypothetical protein
MIFKYQTAYSEYHETERQKARICYNMAFQDLDT